MCVYIIIYIYIIPLSLSIYIYIYIFQGLGGPGTHFLIGNAKTFQGLGPLGLKYCDGSWVYTIDTRADGPLNSDKFWVLFSVPRCLFTEPGCKPYFKQRGVRSVLVISICKVSNRGSQIPEPLLTPNLPTYIIPTKIA